MNSSYELGDKYNLGCYTINKLTEQIVVEIIDEDTIHTKCLCCGMKYEWKTQ